MCIIVVGGGVVGVIMVYELNCWGYEVIVLEWYLLVGNEISKGNVV